MIARLLAMGSQIVMTLDLDRWDEANTAERASQPASVPLPGFSLVD